MIGFPVGFSERFERFLFSINQSHKHYIYSPEEDFLAQYRNTPTTAVSDSQKIDSSYTGSSRSSRGSGKQGRLEA